MKFVYFIAEAFECDSTVYFVLYFNIQTLLSNTFIDVLVLPIVFVVFWQTNTGRHSAVIPGGFAGFGDRACRQPVVAASPTAIGVCVYGGRTAANKRGEFSRVLNKVIRGYFLNV